MSSLSAQVSKEDVRQLFGRFGRVVDVVHQHHIKRQSTGNAYAFVYFADERSVRKALAARGIQLKGLQLEIEAKRVRPQDRRHTAAAARKQAAAAAAAAEGPATATKAEEAGATPDSVLAEGSDLDSRTVYLTNIALETEQLALRRFLGQFGDVRGLQFKECVVRHQAGERRHAGVLATFASEAAVATICALAQQQPPPPSLDFDGRTVKVRARARVRASCAPPPPSPPFATAIDLCQPESGSGPCTVCHRVCV